MLDTATASVSDVPDFNAPFTARVDVLGRIRDRNGAHNLAMSQGINLTRVTWNSRPYQSVCGEWHRLQLTLAVHMERVRSAVECKTLMPLSLRNGMPSIT